MPLEFTRSYLEVWLRLSPFRWVVDTFWIAFSSFRPGQEMHNIVRRHCFRFLLLYSLQVFWLAPFRFQQFVSDSHYATEFIEFTEATRITGGLSKHRHKPYNAYYPNN